MAPISVTFDGIDRLEGAVATKELRACWADAARVSSEVGREAVSSEMREAALDLIELNCD